MSIFLICCFIIFIVYNIFAIKQNNWKIPESLSETSYIWEQTCKHNHLCQAYWFSFLCWFIALSLFFPWLSITSENIQFIPFLGLTGLILCGCTPFFKTSAQAYVHYTSGIIAILCWALWVIIAGYIELLIIFVSLYLITIICDRKNFVYWAEILSFSILFIFLIIIF